ncbi:MAG: glucosaminidase domain-containing protein, partial [Cyclobacteriaceae bacterium]
MVFRKKDWGLFLLTVIAFTSCNEKQKTLQITRVKVDSLSQIHIIKDSLVKPIVYTQIIDLGNQPIPKAKALFISAVLPSILITKHNLETERKKVHKLKEKEKWNKEDSIYYFNLEKQYKASDIENLLKRMSTVPNSIVLAQAAVESGWGKSRFFKEGNNIFGMWSYNRNEPRIKAGLKRASGPIHVRAYDDISQSIADYFKTLGSAHAYRELRT